MQIPQPLFEQDGKLFYQVQDNLILQEVQLVAFMMAIAVFEGFFIPPSDSRYPSKATRNNNPGNIRPVGASEGFQKFNTAEEGWAVLRKQVLLNISRGLSLEEFFLGGETADGGYYPGYSPVADNSVEIMENYISFVAQHTNMARDIDLRAYFPNLAKGGLKSTMIQGF